MKEFDNLNKEEVSDVVAIFCWLSAKANNLENNPSMVPKRPIEETFKNLSPNSKHFFHIVFQHILSKV